MAVPDFQSLMLPFLKVSGDNKEHSISDIAASLAQQLGLTQEDIEELLLSGRQTRFYNRVGWVRTYFLKASLIKTTVRGKYIITERGSEVLASNPAKIDITYLNRFPEFEEFRKASSPKNGDHTKRIEVGKEIEQTPEEILETGYQELSHNLAEELLDRVKGCDPKFFENLVIDLLLAMGYGGSRADAGQAIGRSGDGGIDGIIKEDKLGLDIVYIQAKKWEGTVGRPVVQAFAGSLEGFRARKGVMITTSHFSQDAIEYVKLIEKKIVLINGTQLAQLMIEHDIGVSKIAAYIIKRVDLDYFGEE